MFEVDAVRWVVGMMTGVVLGTEDEDSSACEKLSFIPFFLTTNHSQSFLSLSVTLSLSL